MSLSQERPQNPAKFFLRVKSGTVNYYDKEAGENVEVPTPFEFIVLDQLATVRGWSDTDNSGYWANEVRSVGSDELSVRTSSGLKERGLWKDIKGRPSVAGAKYNASIYVAHKSKEGMVISNLSLTGAALNAWIEFTGKNRTNTNKVILKSWADAKKGSVSYKVPVFEAVPMEDAEKDEAVELDKQLQAYLTEYFNYKPETEVVQEALAVDEDTINLEDIPF